MESFENGTTFAANGWQVVTYHRYLASRVTFCFRQMALDIAYISANGGAAWTYSQFSVFNHMYKGYYNSCRRIKYVLSFKWKVGGEGTTSGGII